ncbi:unnamed protein product [Amoebophrya sp. A25]|nr:unnamed protein product [Amoebophrya sp. A25]|eukprot:GSA25T00011051001.1
MSLSVRLTNALGKNVATVDVSVPNSPVSAASLRDRLIKDCSVPLSESDLIQRRRGDGTLAPAQWIAPNDVSIEILCQDRSSVGSDDAGDAVLKPGTSKGTTSSVGGKSGTLETWLSSKVVGVLDALDEEEDGWLDSEEADLLFCYEYGSCFDRVTKSLLGSEQTLLAFLEENPTPLIEVDVDGQRIRRIRGSAAKEELLTAEREEEGAATTTAKLGTLAESAEDASEAGSPCAPVDNVAYPETGEDTEASVSGTPKSTSRASNNASKTTLSADAAVFTPSAVVPGVSADGVSFVPGGIASGGIAVVPQYQHLQPQLAAMAPVTPLTHGYVYPIPAYTHPGQMFVVPAPVAAPHPVNMRAVNNAVMSSRVAPLLVGKKQAAVVEDGESDSDVEDSMYALSELRHRASVCLNAFIKFLKKYSKLNFDSAKAVGLLARASRSRCYEEVICRVRDLPLRDLSTCLPILYDSVAQYLQPTLGKLSGVRECRVSDRKDGLQVKLDLCREMPLEILVKFCPKLVQVQ